MDSKTVYDYQTRVSHIALLELVVSGMNDSDRNSALPGHILTIDLDADRDGSFEEVSVEAIPDVRETLGQHRQAYLNARVSSLCQEYSAGNFPSGWLLVQGIFSPFTDNRDTIRLVVLLKSPGDGCTGVYCIAHYE